MLPDQMVQTVSVDVGDAAAVEKAMGEAVAKQGAVQARVFVGNRHTQDFASIRTVAFAFFARVAEFNASGRASNHLRGACGCARCVRNEKVESEMKLVSRRCGPDSDECCRLAHPPAGDVHPLSCTFHLVWFVTVRRHKDVEKGR